MYLQISRLINLITATKVKTQPVDGHKLTKMFKIGGNRDKETNTSNTKTKLVLKFYSAHKCIFDVFFDFRTHFFLFIIFDTYFC